MYWNDVSMVKRNQRSQFPDYDALSCSGIETKRQVGHRKGGGSLEFSNFALSKRVMHTTWIVVLALGVVFVARVIHLQVIQHTVYEQRAFRNRTQTIIVAPSRQTVIDRNGIRVADNVPEFQLWFDPELIGRARQSGDPAIIQIPRTFRGLVVSEVDATTIHTPILIAQSDDYPEGLQYISFAAEHNGFRTAIRSKRYYPFGESFAHVLGYVGKMSPDELAQAELQDEYYRLDDEIGKTGIERFYNERLVGERGVRIVEEDAFGNALRVVQHKPAEQASGFRLSIDARVQDSLYRALKAAVTSSGGSGGVAGIMDAVTGELYALVDYPSYDNNVFIERDTASIETLLNDKTLPLFTRSISGQYPSGSIIKPVIALAALNEGIVTDRTTYESTGGIWVGPFYFPDWKDGGHGRVDVYRAIAESVNTYFYYIGGGYGGSEGLGVDRINRYARLFGLGEVTGVDFFGEARGFIPTPEWKERIQGDRWYIGDTYHLSIGQGDLLVTPIQMLQTIAAISQNGIVPQPSVTSHRAPSTRSVSIPQAYFEIVKRGLRETVLTGSAQGLKDLPVAVAGKTGTAQATSGNPHAWFVGFLPYQKPRFAFVVLVENGGEGSSVAVPLARKLIIELFNRYRDQM